MAKYLSNRQKNFKIGISSYTEGKTVLEVTGNVGIGTTNSEGRSLYVVGDGEFTGILTANKIFSSVYGEFIGGITGTNIVGTSLSISGISTLGITSISQLYVSGITTLASDGGITTTGGNLYVGQNLQVAGTSNFIGTAIFRGGTIGIGDSISDNIDVGGEFISNLVPSDDGLYDLGIDGKRWRNARFSSLTTTTDLYVSGVGTIQNLVAANATLTNINSTGISTFGITEISVNSSSNALTITQTGSGNALVVQPNVNGLVVTGIGSVGIGVADPGEKLQINGNLRIGASDSNYIAFRGTTGDEPNQFTHTFIGERIYTPGTEESELFIFKGNDHDLSVEGPDRIRLAAAEFRVDTYTTPTSGSFEDVATSANLTNRMIVKDHGSVGIGTTEPSALLDVYGGFNVSGIGTIATLDTTTGTIDYLSGTNVSYSGIGTLGTLGVTGLTTTQNLQVIGVSTLGVTSVTRLTAQSINSSGIITGSTFRPSTGYIQAADGTNSLYIYSGTGNVAFQGTIGASQVNNAQGYKVLGFTGTNDATFENNVSITGITTSLGGFVGNLTGTATTATKLQNSRTFEITGDIVASPISFNGTGNVSLAATIQPNSVSLGSDTTGDYVQSISGTANQITVTGGTGEGSTPIVAFASNPTIPGNVTIGNDLQVNNNLNVTGNITVGGTTAYIIVQDFRVTDADITLGFTTDTYGNDASTDTTANHGGIAVASTEGNPLVQLVNVAIGESLPATYKKFMWFKAGSFAGLNTDAWLSNYAIGIGSTQFPSGTRLAAGSVQFTEQDLAVVRNINASGIITGTLANNLTLNTSGTGLSGVATYNNSGATTFTVTSNATSNNTPSTIVARDASGNFSAGTITANLTGTASTASFATTAFNLTDAANITTGTINSARLTGTYNIDISGNAATATYAPVAGVATALQNSRTFEITGDIVASPISFDGTGNVSLAATIQPNSVALGGDTTGNYVASVTNGSYITGADGGSEGSVLTIGVAATSSNTASQVVARDASGNFSAGTITANLTGTASTASFATTSYNLTNAANITTGTINSSRLTGTYNIDISGNAATSDYADISGIATYASNAGIATYADSAGIATVAQNVTGSPNITVSSVNSTGVVTATSFSGSGSNLTGIVTQIIAGTNISIDPVGGTGSVTVNSNAITGVLISTNTTNQSQYLIYSTSTGSTTGFGVSTSGLVFNPSSNNLGIATTNPTSKLHVIGDGYFAGVVTATTFVGNLTGTATTATNLANAANITTGTINSARLSGTYNISISGNAATATYATSSGIATYATSSGISTNLKGGLVGNIPYQSATDTTAFLANGSSGTILQSNGVGNPPSWVTPAPADAITGLTVRDEGTIVGGANSITSLNFVGSIVSVASTLGIATITFLDYVSNAGVATSVIGGIGSLTQLQVTGLSTFSNGPVFIGAATSTGTESQTLQVTGGAYVSNNLGIGSTNPTSKLYVVGDGYFTGILTANRIISNVYGEFTGGSISGTNIVGTALSISGISTFTNGPVLIGSATSTGTENQRLQVVGGASFTGIGYNIGVGTTNPSYTLTVTDTGTPATSGLTNCLADFTTTANSYGQINLRNTSTGTNASGDIIITADNGSDSTNFIDLGINNSGFSIGSWTINGANDGYLYTSDGNLSIGAINSSVAKYISFFTGGTLISNERMRINSTGVGIGTTNPQYPLQVQGNARVTGAIYDSTNSPGTSGQVLSSTVTGTQWTTAGTSTLDILEVMLFA